MSRNQPSSLSTTLSLHAPSRAISFGVWSEKKVWSQWLIQGGKRAADYIGVRDLDSSAAYAATEALCFCPVCRGVCPVSSLPQKTERTVLR